VKRLAQDPTHNAIVHNGEDCPDDEPEGSTSTWEMILKRFPFVDYSFLPPHMQEGTEGYVERGVNPGGFLYAVLTNDLINAAGRADTINLLYLDKWARWLFNEAPSTCWGSKERVAAWIARSRRDEPTEADMQAGMPGQVRSLTPPSRWEYRTGIEVERVSEENECPRCGKELERSEYPPYRNACGDCFGGASVNA